MVRGLLMLTFVVSPVVAAGQSLELYGSAGPTVNDTGHSFSVGAGFSPHPRLTLVFGYDQTHVPTQTTRFSDGISHFRGGTLYLATGELRVLPFRRDRFGPYGVAGLAAGVSRPNVNEVFRNYVSNHAQGLILGGGLHAPFGEHLAFFGDYRIVVGAEGNDGMFGVAPLRVGLAWRF